MEPDHRHVRSAGHRHDHAAAASVDRIALMATLHCLTGCAIGEVAGMTIGTALAWSNAGTIALAVALAFVSGFALTAWPLLRSGHGVAASVRIAIAADAASITVMEIVDNALMILIPGAMDAPLDSALFWSSLAISLVVAAVVVFPVNRLLIARGRGHALAHDRHSDP